jgi:phage gp16-like protein
MGAAALAPAGHRRAMMAKVHLAKKELGLDDETYRAVVLRVTTRASSADCTEAQLAALLDEFKRLGWKGAKAGPSKRATSLNHEIMKPRAADHPSAKKARALWISLYQLGVVREPSEQALEAFAARQLKCERLQWADQGQVYKLIEALKAMAERAGWSQDLNGVRPADHVETLKLRLANALRAKLGLKPFGSGWYLDETLDEAIERMAAWLRRQADEAQP